MKLPGSRVCPQVEGCLPWVWCDTPPLPSRASLSTRAIPAAILCPAMHPAATVMTAGLTLWTPWSPSKTPSPRVAPVTVASTLHSTPPVPAACPWPKHHGPRSHTSPLEVWVCVVGVARPLGGPTTQTDGARSLQPLQLLARATGQSCTPQVPAPPQAWLGAAVTHQGSPGKALHQAPFFWGPDHLPYHHSSDSVGPLPRHMVIS
jgi:hypothetical protein